MTAPIRFGVQAGVMGAGRAWPDLARKAEACGFDALYVSDHPGVTASPFSSLAAAALVTSTLRLGTYVCNTGVRDPVQLASEAATVDVLSDGRFILGLGAGHTPAEWTMAGRRYPTAAARVTRFGEMVGVVTRLLAGEVVTFYGGDVNAEEAFLLAPRPVQDRIQLLVGGNGKRLLRIAARYADAISLTGLGRTLEDGHRHTADWSVDGIDERIALITQAAAERAPVVLDALVQHVEITDDPATVAARVASAAPGLTPNDVLAAPYALVGAVDEIVDQLLAYRERWGFTSYVVRADSMEAVTPVIARLGRHDSR